MRKLREDFTIDLDTVDKAREQFELTKEKYHEAVNLYQKLRKVEFDPAAKQRFLKASKSYLQRKEQLKSALVRHNDAWRDLLLAKEEMGIEGLSMESNPLQDFEGFFAE